MRNVGPQDLSCRPEKNRILKLQASARLARTPELVLSQGSARLARSRNSHPHTERERADTARHRERGARTLPHVGATHRHGPPVRRREPVALRRPAKDAGHERHTGPRRERTSAGASPASKVALGRRAIAGSAARTRVRTILSAGRDGEAFVPH